MQLLNKTPFIAYDELIFHKRMKDWLIKKIKTLGEHDQYKTNIIASMGKRDAQKYWYNQLEDIIKKNTDYGLFSSFMNRVGQPFQIPNGIDRNNHDMRYHRNVGKELQNINYDNVIQFPNNAPLSGVVILISKKTWKDIGGFKEGFLGVDNTLHRDCINNNIKVGLMLGFYVYHWYRADGDMSHINESNKLHKNPYF